MDKDLKSKIVSIKSEENEVPNDDVSYNLTSWGADLSFRELIDMSDETNKELIKPDLQRKYVWDKLEASRFIDSILIGLPIPSIFLYKTSEERFLIVDGYQRIMTVLDYVKNGVFERDKKSFNLSNSKKINIKWRDKTYKELDDVFQRKIKNTTIHTIIFKQNMPNDDSSMYQVFERINTSGRSLMPQEIRNCIYQGSFNNLLFELNIDIIWRELFGAKEQDIRMRDVEMILRYFTLNTPKVLESTSTQISLIKELNTYMKKCKTDNPEEIELKRGLFQAVMHFIKEFIGVDAFNNISPKEPYKVIKRFHPTIFDSIAIATCRLLQEKDIKKVEDLNLQFENLKENYPNLEQKRITLLQNADYIKYISQRTTNIANIKGRIDKAYEFLYS